MENTITTDSTDPSDDREHQINVLTKQLGDVTQEIEDSTQKLGAVLCKLRLLGDDTDHEHADLYGAIRAMLRSIYRDDEGLPPLR